MKTSLKRALKAGDVKTNVLRKTSKNSVTTSLKTCTFPKSI
jgi:hypothetical protein